MRRTWLREPLLHFAVLGLAIFAVDALISGRADDATVIRVDGSLKADLARKFEQSTQRPPTREELEQMVDGWVRQEVLYREGLALGLDRSDGFIRERVISLVQALTINGSDLGTPSEAELRAYFERTRSDYVRPRLYDFEHVMIRGGGDGARAQAQSVARALDAGDAPRDLGYRVLPMRGRSGDQLVGIFGPDFVARLRDLPVGEWRAAPSERAWHAVRVRAIDPGGAADFTAARARVEEAWRQDQTLKEAAARYREMRASYKVVEAGKGG